MAFGGGESTRSPEGGSIVGGVGGVVEEGSMVHALRVLMLRPVDSFCFRSLIVSGLGKNRYNVRGSGVTEKREK